MTSYVVVYGQPEALGDSDELQAVVLVEGTKHVCLSDDDGWIRCIRDRAQLTALSDDVLYGEDLLRRLTDDLGYFQRGPVVSMDCPLADAEQVLERLYITQPSATS